MRQLLALVLVACAGAPNVREEPSPPRALDVDLAAAEQSYREHAAAIAVRDLEGYRASLADPATCLEDARELRPSALEESDLPMPYHVLSVAIEALPDGGARAREWIARAALEDEPPRVEPRVIDLYPMEGRFRVTRIVSVGADCGAASLLEGMDPASAFAECDALVERCRAAYRDAGAPGEEVCERRRDSCIRPSGAGCLSLRASTVPEAGACSSDGWCVVHPDRPGPGPTAAVWARSVDDVYFGGANGLVRYDGASYRRISGVARGVSSITGFDDGTIALAAEDGVYVGDGESLRRVHEAIDREQILAVGGRSSDTIYAVGERGTVLRCDRSSCARMPRVTPQQLCGVVEARGELIAIGESGTLVRSDGARWTVETIPNAGFEDIGLDARGRAIVVGEGLEGGLVMVRDGARWTREDGPADVRFLAVASTFDRTIALGDRSIVRLPERTVEPLPSEVRGLVHALWARDAAMILAGESGVYLTRGEGWERAATFVSRGRMNIARGSVPTDLWMDASLRELLHWREGVWSPREAPFEPQGVVRLSDGRVLATSGARTGVLDGDRWSVHEHPELFPEGLTLDRSGAVLAYAGSEASAGIYAWRGDRWERTMPLARRPRVILSATRALDRQFVDNDIVVVAITRGRRSEIARARGVEDIVGDGDVLAFRSYGSIWIGRGSRVTEMPSEATGVDRLLLVAGGHVYASADGAVLEHDGRAWTRTALPDGVSRVESLARVGDELWATTGSGVILRRAAR
jgi:hypothetical protein